ncbi:MAG TPA: HDIG domain-containing protein [Planctomycetota bacterium]|nr:HDIG domain-containing protein [Planctomycetota bacterium]
MKSAVRTSRTGITTIIPVGTPRAKSGLFGGEGLGPPGVLLCLLFCALAALILDLGVLPPSFKVSQPSPLDFYARASFSYVDQDEEERLKTEAAARAPRVYVEEEHVEDKVLGDLEKLASIGEHATSETDALEKLRTEQFQSENAAQTFQSLATEMYRHKGVALSRTMSAAREAVRRQYSRHAVLSDDDYRTEAMRLVEPRQLVRVSMREGNQETTMVEARDCISLSEALDTIKRELMGTDQDASLRTLQWQLTNIYLQEKLRPGLIFDQGRTDKWKKEVTARVGSGVVQIKKGEPILKKGVNISKSMLAKLHYEYAAVKDARPLRERLTHLAGLFFLAAGLLVAFFIIVGRIEPGIWRRGRALIMLGLIFLAILAISRLLLLFNAGLPFNTLAFAPVIFLGMAASLAFGQAVALLALLGLSLLIACASVGWQAVPIDGGMPFFSAALFVGGVGAAIPADKLRDRLDLLRYGVIGGLLQGLLVVAMTLLRGTGAEADFAGTLWPHEGLPTLLDAAVVGSMGPICGMVMLGVLPLFEKTFGILTNPALLEWADMNSQPALRRIQLEAPGTFAHTLQVRFLAEPASDAIGAHTRLVSAGTLYHDLGKTLKPEYFVENTPEAEERHRRLKPSVSALLIISHVKDGVDLAREYRLPQQIIDFIPEHHGTSLVSYFFHTAKRDAEKGALAEGSENEVEVEEAFFRYPGPKPQTRETGIVMLADTVEAASRTLHSPSATRLRQLVHDLIMDKLLDNQLDECGLTFADLALIEDAFIRVLVTRFHSRIRYPGQEEEEEESQAEEREDTDRKGSDDSKKDDRDDESEPPEKEGHAA